MGLQSEKLKTAMEQPDVVRLKIQGFLDLCNAAQIEDGEAVFN